MLALKSYKKNVNSLDLDSSITTYWRRKCRSGWRRHLGRRALSLNISPVKQDSGEGLSFTKENNEENNTTDISKKGIVCSIKQITDQTSDVEHGIKNPRLIVIHQDDWVGEKIHLQTNNKYIINFSCGYNPRK